MLSYMAKLTMVVVPLKVHVLLIFTQMGTVIKRKEKGMIWGRRNLNCYSIDSNKTSLRIKAQYEGPNKSTARQEVKVRSEVSRPIQQK